MNTRTRKLELSPDDMIDVTAPEILEILIRTDGKVVWINVDGVCRFRACKLKNLVLNDERINK